MRSDRTFIWILLALTVLVCLPGCRAETEDCACAGRTLRVSSTTSVDNTGLWAALLPPFEKRTGIRVQILAVGTGQALRLAENGDVDAVLVHDRRAEEAFLAAGHGVNHLEVMHNDFVIVGPTGDPAGARGTDAVAAMRAIGAASAAFVSRGDRSGTHKAELGLWSRAGVEPGGAWYLEAGQGMRLTLNMADQKQAYCLVDRATFLVAQDRVSLRILVEGDSRLHNPYSFMATSPDRHPGVHHVEAMALAGWLASPEGRRVIREFRKDGQALFVPARRDEL